MWEVVDSRSANNASMEIKKIIIIVFLLKLSFNCVDAVV